MTIFQSATTTAFTAALSVGEWLACPGMATRPMISRSNRTRFFLMISSGGERRHLTVNAEVLQCERLGDWTYTPNSRTAQTPCDVALRARDAPKLFFGQHQ